MWRPGVVTTASDTTVERRTADGLTVGALHRGPRPTSAPSIDARCAPGVNAGRNGAAGSRRVPVSKYLVPGLVASGIASNQARPVAALVPAIGTDLAPPASSAAQNQRRTPAWSRWTSLPLSRNCRV
jgi:hypothetical protein